MRLTCKNKKYTFIIYSLLLFFIGCSAKELIHPDAARIIVTKTPAPKTCKFRGTVTGSQGGSFTGGFTSNRNMAEGAMNDLKNQAFRLGANYVVLETNQAGNTQSGGSNWGGGFHFSGQQTDVTNTGNAYACPPKDVGL